MEIQTLGFIFHFFYLPPVRCLTSVCQLQQLCALVSRTSRGRPPLPLPWPLPWPLPLPWPFAGAVFASLAQDEDDSSDEPSPSGGRSVLYYKGLGRHSAGEE